MKLKERLAQYWHKYFKSKFDEKPNYTLTLLKKNILLRCNENKMNDEIFRKKSMYIFLINFLIMQKFDMSDASFYPLTNKENL